MSSEPASDRPVPATPDAADDRAVPAEPPPPTVSTVDAAPRVPLPAPPTYDGPYVPPWAVRKAIDWRECVAAGVVGCVLAALGLAMAFIWVWAAPELRVFIDGQGSVLTGEEPEEFIASDGRYAMVMASTGLVVGVAAWFVRRWRGPLMLVAVAVGSIACSWIAWRLGESIGEDALRDDLMAIGRGHSGMVRVVQLRAEGLMYVQAIIATITYVVCASWARYPNLVPPRRPAETSVSPGMSRPPT